MKLDGGRGILIVICALTVIVMGVAIAGPVSGLTFSDQDFIFSLFHHDNTTVVFTTTHHGTQTTHTGTRTSVGSTHTGTATQVGGSSPPGSTPAIPGFVVWYLLVPIVVLLGAGLVYAVSRRTGDGEVVDLTNELEQMEEQRSYLASLSSRLRNLALLRYYVLLQSICQKVKIVDELAETPQEFVKKASTTLNVDMEEALKFAHTVDLARYGPELSDAQVSQASKVMDMFTSMVRMRIENA